MGEFSLWHILLILIVVLIFFGPSRLPGLGNSLGKAIRGFKDGLKGMTDSVEEKPAQKAHEPLSSGEKEDNANQTKNKNNTSS